MNLLLIILLVLILCGGGYGFRSGALVVGNALSTILFVVLILVIVGLLFPPYPCHRILW